MNAIYTVDWNRMNAPSVCYACNEPGHRMRSCPNMASDLDKGFYKGERMQDEDDHDHDCFIVADHLNLAITIK